jgi:hypothetical protein
VSEQSTPMPAPFAPDAWTSAWGWGSADDPFTQVGETDGYLGLCQDVGPAQLDHMAKLPSDMLLKDVTVCVNHS